MIARNPIRVLAVDGSAFFRKVLGDILGNREEMSLVGYANDAYAARDLLRSLTVDVLTLELELPRMNGLTFLKLIMERKPMPVIILSSVTPAGSQKAIEALIAGAADVIEKPKSPADKLIFAQKLIDSIRKAATSRKRPLIGIRSPSASPLTSTVTTFNPRKIIAIGASTGGTQALEEVLAKLPQNLPGIVVVQHIPPGFSARFATRLNKASAMEVREAKSGDVIRSGLALIAPGDRHIEVQWVRDHYRVMLHDGPKVEHQRPSVDVLFKSLAACAGRHAIAVLLTGMGKDGAAGMKQLHDLKAHTIAQDAMSSVVYGMARKAVELKAVDSIVPLENLARKIVKALEIHHHRVAVPSYE